METNTDKHGNEISEEKVREFISSLKPEYVLSVYTGKIGCMCGCIGNYKYNPQHREEAAADRGYEVTEKECSSRSVSIVLNKVKKFSGVSLLDGRIVDYRDEVKNRQYAVYLRSECAL